MNDIKKEVGNRLAEIRKSKKLRQDELKELLDVPTVQMISNWENGHIFPSTTYLIIIAKKLDISLDYLLLGKQNNSNTRKMKTYKDVAESIVELEQIGLFDISDSCITSCKYLTTLTTMDDVIHNFKIEYCNLLIASKSLRPELFKQAVADLLEKYDIPIKKIK